jgi:rhodanese-related sulfurtransferase/DNA-binding transcriptional ArsR family regulator
MHDASHRLFKDRLYGRFALIGKALASPHRFELLELLAQGPCTVELLSRESELSLANASQHLQILRQAGLVEARKQGLFVEYRLAGPDIYELCKALRSVAENRHAELERLVRDYFGGRSNPEPVRMEELIKRIRHNGIVILDARPASEFAAGHIAGALSVPIEELQKRLRKLPKSKEYVAYCRGPYCVYADRAVELLRLRGRRARRLIEGFPEWKAAGFPVEIGRQTDDAQQRERRRAWPLLVQ